MHTGIRLECDEHSFQRTFHSQILQISGKFWRLGREIGTTTHTTTRYRDVCYRAQSKWQLGWGEGIKQRQDTHTFSERFMIRTHSELKHRNSPTRRTPATHIPWKGAVRRGGGWSVCDPTSDLKWKSPAKGIIFFAFKWANFINKSIFKIIKPETTPAT